MLPLNGSIKHINPDAGMGKKEEAEGMEKDVDLESEINRVGDPR